MMQAACYLLLAVATIGLADDWYYHARTCRLRDRPECQKEIHWHNVRSFAFALELLVIANLHLRGAAVGALAVILGISWYGKIRDVMEETPSRRAQGGLPAGEYLVHVIATALEGAFVTVLVQAAWPDLWEPTGVDWSPPIHAAIRALMTAGGLYAVAILVVDVRRWSAFQARLRGAP